MNTLSTFLWLADVLPNAGQLFSIGGSVVVVVGSFIYLISQTDPYDMGCIAMVKLMRVVLPVALLVAVMGMLIPSQKTFYAIAASELGEDVYKSQAGQKIVGLLQDYIVKKLEAK